MFVDIITKNIHQIYHAVVRVVYRIVIDLSKTKKRIGVVYCVLEVA